MGRPSRQRHRRPEFLFRSRNRRPRAGLWGHSLILALEQGLPAMRRTLLAGTTAALLSATAAYAQTTPDTFTVYFKLNQASLSADGRRTVDEAAAAFRQNGSARVDVTGHADLTGSRAHNQALSERR